LVIKKEGSILSISKSIPPSDVSSIAILFKDIDSWSYLFKACGRTGVDKGRATCAVSLPHLCGRKGQLEGLECAKVICFYRSLTSEIHYIFSRFT
jgi:hypothetical protein